MSTRYRWSLWWTVLLGFASPAAAQQPADSVAIHPVATSVDVAPYSTNTQRFWVVNVGTQANQYGVFANVCAPYDLYCEWSNPFLGTIGSGDSVAVDVKFTAGAAGTSGTISFEARINTNQSIRAAKTFMVNARQETHLEVAALNPGSAEERDLCLTVGVATEAAYECGDLRLVHTLPSVRARGTVRTPTLLYNSRFAHPFGLVTATFSTPAHDLTNVTARLRVPRSGGDIVVSQGFADALFTASSVRKFVLAFDASALPTGVYPYTLTTTFSLGGTPDSTTASGELIVVNWKTSPFGAGWWLAGYERMYAQPDSSLLWVGGDGSARHYASPVSGIYKAPAIDHPDSITVESGNFVRHLRGGAKVEFSPDGKHFATSDRLGLVTFFHHDQYGQMAHIDPAGFSALRYDFAYSGFTGPLETVTAPAVNGVARVVQRYVLGDGRILLHTDPDGSVVQFGFDGTISERITARTNRRGVVQSFGFDALGKLVTVRVPLTASDTAVTTFCPAESRGYVSTACSSGPLHPDSAVTVMDGPRTDATDVTTFRLDRFGAPRVIRDALGNQTQLFRGNRDFPGVVTRVVHANGWVNDAFHDAKGLVTKLVQYAPLGPDFDAVTEYAWDAKWERVTQITFPEKNVLQFAYDTATGNRIWQQDGRGATSRTEFGYLGNTGNARFLLATITYAADARGVRSKDSLSYDSLGNLSEYRSGAGTSAAGVMRYFSDSLGRVVRASADITLGGAQQQDSTTYDLMDRVVRTATTGPAMNGAAAESLFTRRSYDDEGNLRRVVRWSRPDVPSTPIDSLISRFGYDLADRQVADTAPGGAVQVRQLDRAGNDTATTTRRGHVIRTRFDVLNRVIQRNLPGLSYSERTAGIYFITGQALNPSSNTSYPRLDKNGSGGLTIAADSETFAYDAMGRMIAARNATSRIVRTYFANGLLNTETDSVATYDRSDFTRHVYTTAYGYDLNGRRTGLTLPPSLTTSPVQGTKNTIAYTYDASSGLPSTETDLLEKVFTYTHDGASHLTDLSMPGGISQHWRHDSAGRVVLDSIRNQSTSAKKFSPAVLRRLTLTYDARAKALQEFNGAGKKDSLSAEYSGLGYLLRSQYSDSANSLLGPGQTGRSSSSERFRYDGLGNPVLDTLAYTGRMNDRAYTQSGPRTRTYEPGTGRVVSITTVAARVDSLFYDAAGNVEFSTGTAFSGISPEDVQDRASYYDAADRLVAVDHRWSQARAGVARAVWPIRYIFDVYRYDALGRRVVVRSRHACNPSDLSSDDCPLSFIRRTIWDGDQELLEIQQPGGVSVPDSTLERDTGAVGVLPLFERADGLVVDPNAFFGRVAYTHGLGVDQPLSLTRWEYADSASGVVGVPNGYQRWVEPFAIVPHWNARGSADNGTFADGGSTTCGGGGIATRCVRLNWQFGWSTYGQATYRAPSWQGSLVEDKRDGTGLTFRRNRYVDPNSGQFTQEDPIGLAGGLNLYGFASGDPVNFSDPFGLCPPEKRDKDGRCPGGLTVAQWDRVEYAAKNRMTPEARALVLGLLERGKIHSKPGVISGFKQVAAVTSSLTKNADFAEETFSYELGDFAFLLAHEAQHTRQFFMSPGKREPDADAFGCTNTWGRTGYFAGAYRSEFGPCGSGAP
jgi:RHS repeat-associated protein